jgi:hypothetical protein
MFAVPPLGHPPERCVHEARKQPGPGTEGQDDCTKFNQAELSSGNHQLDRFATIPPPMVTIPILSSKF